MKDTKGMSVVLRVIVTGVVLIMIAMTVVFIGTGGLQRVAGPGGQTETQTAQQIKETACWNALNRRCRNRDVDTFNLDDTVKAYVQGQTVKCVDELPFNSGTTVTCTATGAKIGK